MAHHHRMSITRKDIQRAERHLSRRDPITGPAGRMSQFKQSATVGGATFLAGLVKGYYGPMMCFAAKGADTDKTKFQGVPAELLAFLATGVFAASGYAGKYGTHVANIADGIGAGYLHTLGAGIGDQMFLKNKGRVAWTNRMNPLLANENFAGALGSGTAPLTQAELRAMASAVRG